MPCRNNSPSGYTPCPTSEPSLEVARRQRTRSDADERTGLLSNKRKPRSHVVPVLFCLLSLFVIALFASNIVQYITYENSVDRPEYRDRIRKEWDQENIHRRERIIREDKEREQKWAEEEARRKEHLAREDALRQREWEAEQARRKDRIAREDAQREEVFRKRSMALDERQKRMNEDELCRKRRIALEDAEREEIFRSRTLVLDERQKRIDAKERAMREEKVKRERAGLFWAHLTMHEKCLEYGTRQYHAELMNVPRGEDAEKWCMETPIEIHGIIYNRPGYCAIEGDVSDTPQVFAYWTVKSEPTCMTSWGDLRDKGCELRGSHKRLFEAQLIHHQPPWDNWREMCSTTPIHFDDHEYAHPIYCDNRGHEGVWGTWIVHDDGC